MTSAKPTLSLVLDVCETIRTDAAKAFADRGELWPPAAFLFLDRGAMPVSPGMVGLTEINPGTMRIFFTIVRELSRRVEAKAVVFVAEVWFLLRDYGAPMPPPSEAPDRTEVLYMKLEHVDTATARVWIAKIKRPAPAAKPTTEPWEELPIEAATEGGPMADLLSPDRKGPQA